MKITQILTRSVPINSDIRNAYIRFIEMTGSIVMAKTDVLRNSGPVVDLGFCSNGRYVQTGILEESMIPRITSTPDHWQYNVQASNRRFRDDEFMISAKLTKGKP